MQAVLMNKDIAEVDPEAGQPISVSSVQDRFAAASLVRQSLPASLVAAGGVAIILLASYLAVEGPRVLPAYGIASLLLVVAVQQDILRRKIPNWLVMSGIATALAYNVMQSGLTGLFASLIGCFLPFVMLIAIYIARGMGAGDIKTLMALGTLWGGSVVLQVIAWCLVIGGVMALLVLLFHGELLSMLRRWGRILVTLVVQRQIRYEHPGEGEAAAGALPFGIAIALGVAVTQLVHGGVI
jgi:prepilin peptidase CpaA